MTHQQPLAIIKIPRLLPASQQHTNTTIRHCIDLSSRVEFERLHSTFIQS